MNNITLTALAEPNRLRIVELLRNSPQPVGEIAQQLGLRQPQASKHLRTLHDAGLVSAMPIAQLRVYYLQPAPFEELDSWLASFKIIWETRLDSLDGYLQSNKKFKE